MTQNRFVAIWFKNLDIDWLLRKRPELYAQPVAFQTKVRNKLTVVSSNDLARQAGAHPGTSIADTKLLCPSLQVFDYDERLSPALLDILSDWCFRYTPIVAPDHLDGIFLDVTGCTHLLGTERRFLAHIVKKLLSLGYTVRAAMADTPGAAWAVARYGTKEPIVPVGQTREHLAALPIHCLRLSSETTEKLITLGLRMVAQLFNIPSQMLLKRYGKEVVMRLSQAVGDREEHLKPRLPAPDLSVRLDIIETVSTVEGIGLAASKLIDELCLLLEKHKHGVQQMHLFAYRIDGNLQNIVIGTAAPTRNPKHLLRLLRERLGTLEPGLGFELFVLAAYVAAPLEAGQDQLLPEPGDNHLQETMEMVDRMASKIGARNIMRFEPVESNWPNRAFITKQASDKAKKAWPTHLVRPTRLLERPIEIQVIAPVPDYPPKMFRYNGKPCHIRHADGPERIEGEWWLQNHEMRDYYRLEDTEGRRYWVYRSGHYMPGQDVKWFLHGFL